MQVSTILDSIDEGNFALPEFQRGYVWSRDQVRQFFQSLYAQFPVGSLLVWTTRADATAARGKTADQWQTVKLILDGQQRITSLYGVIRGNEPAFFHGNRNAFKDLYFDVRSETFEFYGPVKMKDDPLWVDVTSLFKEGLAPWIGRISAVDGIAQEQTNQYLERLSQVINIEKTDFHIEEVTGKQYDIDTVVEIFNRVNSGGTKLSKGDLALAKICAEWPPARSKMLEDLDRWKEAGFSFRLDWLLRIANALITGEALFSALRDVEPPEFQAGLQRAVDSVDTLLNLVDSRLGLDHDQVLGGRYAFVVMARCLDQQGGGLDQVDENRMLFWYVHSSIWGRHSGSTETVLNTDLEAVDQGGVDRLIEILELWRGDLRIRPEHFAVAERGSRFYSFLYLLTRVWGARDLGTGNELSTHLLGKLASLDLHHIFPRALLKDLGYKRREVNALGNYCLLTKKTNLEIGRKRPAEYLGQYEEQHPGVLASQWIPTDPALWHEDRYPDFVAARRELLAEAGNAFLDSLRTGEAERRPEPEPRIERVEPVVVGGEEDPELKKVSELVAYLGLATPETNYEELDEAGELILEADAAWPDGLQEGLSEPCAFLLESDEEMESRLGRKGFRFFTDFREFRRYVETIVGFDIDGDGVVGFPDEESDDSEGSPGDRSDVEVERKRFLEEVLRKARPELEELGFDPSRQVSASGYNVDVNWDDDRRWLLAVRSGDATDRFRAMIYVYGYDTTEENEVFLNRFATHRAAIDSELRSDHVLHWNAHHGNKHAKKAALAVCRWPGIGYETESEEGARRLIEFCRGVARAARAMEEDPESTEVADTDLERLFDQAMKDVYNRAKSEAGYTATYFAQMLGELGGLVTAKKLITSNQPSEGFTALWERDRIDLTVEAQAMRPAFASLFSATELRAARDRLRAYGYEAEES